MLIAIIRMVSTSGICTGGLQDQLQPEEMDIGDRFENECNKSACGF